MLYKKQSGITLGSVIAFAIIASFVLLVGIKVTPVIVEYQAIKKSLVNVVKEFGQNPDADIRSSFDRYANIHDISSIDSSDLKISREGGSAVISFAYQRKVPLVSNASLLFEYSATVR